jgi:ABC-type nitrate/sulfonate/bicarbonate transport system ATPase subunit
MIDLQQVSFGYPRGPLIFEDFTWQVLPGEAWAVLGASGCGKTTLLYLLAGLQHPVCGTIRVGGEVLDRPRPRTGLILQDYGLLPWATVRENVSLGLRVRQFYGPDGLHAPSGEVVTAVKSRVDYWLEQLGLDEVAPKYPGQISGGQRQRTAIARTLVLNPDLLLMDEPFASLDAPTRESLQNFVRDLNQERGLTIVLVTHSIDEAALLGRRVLVLGLPPNRLARIFENPVSEPGSTEYQAACRALRQILEDGT